jgi:cobalt-zinc-cadmium efflux system outer membrane protein
MEFYFYLRHVWVCVALIFGGGVFSLASATELNPQDVVEMALERNPWLRAARTVVAQAEGRLLQAGRLDNPELALSYAGDQVFNDEGEQSFGLAFIQRFPVTNRLKLEKSLAAREVEVARVEIENEVRLLVQEVQLAIVALATTQAELELREQLKQLNREFLEFIESRVQTGEASLVEVDQLRLALYGIEQEVHHLEHRLTIEKFALWDLMGGVVPDAELKLADAITMYPSSPALPDFDQAHLEAHPQYRLRRLLLQLAEGRIANTRAERWADVALQVFYEEERGVDAPEGLGRDRFFGFALSVPLPLHDRQQGTLAAQHAERSEMQWRLQATASELRVEADLQRRLVADLHHQAVKYESEVSGLVERNLAAMQEAYAKGLISLTELVQTQTQRLKIQSMQLGLLSELAQARIHWSAATGVDLMNFNYFK